MLSDYELDMRFAKLTDIRVDPRLKQLQALLPAMEKRLKRPGVTLTQIWEGYRAQYPKDTATRNSTAITDYMPTR